YELMVAFTRPGQFRTPARLPAARRRAPGGRLPGGAAGMRCPSGGVQETVEHPHPEPQPVDRDPLVDAVEHAGEVQLRRQLQRREPEAADAEVVEGLG